MAYCQHFKHRRRMPIGLAMLLLAAAPCAPAAADNAIEEVVVTEPREKGKDGSNNIGTGNNTGDPNHGQTELSTKNPQGNYCPHGDNDDGTCVVPDPEEEQLRDEEEQTVKEVSACVKSAVAAFAALENYTLHFREREGFADGADCKAYSTTSRKEFSTVCHTPTMREGAVAWDHGIGVSPATPPTSSHTNSSITRRGGMTVPMLLLSPTPISSR